MPLNFALAYWDSTVPPLRPTSNSKYRLSSTTQLAQTQPNGGFSDLQPDPHRSHGCGVRLAGTAAMTSLLSTFPTARRSRWR
jgi:hypothetical protein